MKRSNVIDKSALRRRYIRFCSCLGALLLLACLWVIPLVLDSRNTLSTVGRKVADASDWTRQPYGYYWDSNESQIYVDASNVPVLRRFEDRSGKATPLDESSVQQAVSSGTKFGNLPSPDGKWLLCKPRDAEFTTAIETESHRTVHWTSVPRIQIDHAWFPDSRRWVELVPADGNRTQAIVHSIGTPDRRSAVIPPVMMLIGISSASHLLTVTIDINPELWEYDLEGNQTNPAKHRLDFPSGGAIYEVEGSPDGRRVAYLVEERRVSSIAQLLRRLWYHPSDSSKILSLWVSRTDGSELRRIGYERVTESAGLHWAPDCKKLGIFLDDDFYVVPTD